MPGRDDRRPPGGIASDPAAIAEQFVRRILNGEPAPGARLTEREIVEYAGCTHACARDVIHRLHMLGAVSVFRRKGARVFGPEDAAPEEVERVWRALTPLVEKLAGAPLEAPAGLASPALQVMFVNKQLDRLGGAANDPRLIGLLKRIALQRVILAGVRP